MSTGVEVAGWIKRVADDERSRDAAHVEQATLAARRADLAGQRRRRLIDDLRSAMVRDTGAFRGEFAGDAARDVVVGVARADGAFSVTKPAPSAASLSMTPKPDEGILTCTYLFARPDGLPPREDHVQIVFADTGDEALTMQHYGTGRTFAGCDDLSEFLLVPVLTGRPR